MSTDLERRLRDELTGLAATTCTAPGALDAIVERAARPGLRARVPIAVAVGLVAVLAVVAVAVVVADDGRAQRVVADLPPGPPPIAGTVVAAVQAGTCNSAFCVGGARFDVSDPRSVQRLSSDGRWAAEADPGRENALALPDGRLLRATEDGTTVVADPATGGELSVGAVRAVSADVLADGRVVMVGVRSDGIRVGVVDPGGGGFVEQSLPEGFIPHAVAAGPDGRFGVLGDERECCLNEPALLVVEPDGTEVLHDLSDALGDRRQLVEGDPELSWSTAGLVAVSSDLPEPFIPSQQANGWVVVVDPDGGKQVAAIDGWQGLAWSPDGRGLLVARRAGPRSSELAVLWGPELSERIDLGRVPLPVLPRFWLP